MNIFGKKETLYVIIGEPITEHPPEWDVPFEKYVPPDYETDPRHYNLSVFDEDFADDESTAEIRAFIDRDDAISFAYSCNLVTVWCPVFEKIDGEWVKSDKKTEKMAKDIN